MTFSLINEMNEVPELLRGFDATRTHGWLSDLDKAQRILLTGEGSSRILPAKNLIARALQQNKKWNFYTEGARQAAEYDLRDQIIIAASNSGRTRELIELLQKVKPQKIFGVTATPNSNFAEVCDNTLLLNCGSENATAATKSVVETALVYQSLLQGEEWQYKSQAADHAAAILTQKIPDTLVGACMKAPTIYWAGRNNGVAEELTLKTNEILRKASIYLEGTYAVHGIEEVMQKDEVVLWIDPFPSEWDKIKKTLVDGVGMQVIAIAADDTIFPTIKIPSLNGFDTYFQLLAGWNMLAAAGLRLNIDLDKPVRARKIGNAV